MVTVDIILIKTFLGGLFGLNHEISHYLAECGAVIRSYSPEDDKMTEKPLTAVFSGAFWSVSERRA